MQNDGKRNPKNSFVYFPAVIDKMWKRFLRILTHVNRKNPLNLDLQYEIKCICLSVWRARVKSAYNVTQLKEVLLWMWNDKTLTVTTWHCGHSKYCAKWTLNGSLGKRFTGSLALVLYLPLSSRLCIQCMTLRRHWILYAHKIDAFDGEAQNASTPKMKTEKNV